MAPDQIPADTRSEWERTVVDRLRKESVLDRKKLLSLLSSTYLNSAEPNKTLKLMCQSVLSDFSNVIEWAKLRSPALVELFIKRKWDFELETHAIAKRDSEPHEPHPEACKQILDWIELIAAGYATRKINAMHHGGSLMDREVGMVINALEQRRIYRDMVNTFRHERSRVIAAAKKRPYNVVNGRNFPVLTEFERYTLAHVALTLAKALQIIEPHRTTMEEPVAPWVPDTEVKPEQEEKVHLPKAEPDIKLEPEWSLGNLHSKMTNRAIRRYNI